MRFRRSNPSSNEHYDGQHRFEHWYRDNSVYFITARCRDKYQAYQSEEAKAVFWNRFDFYTSMYGFVPWVVTLLSNHYHVIGYLRRGANLGPMMRKLHGSVAKLVNDVLPERRVPFWRDDDHNDYFDGCIRNELQGRLAYRYTESQAVRARLVRAPAQYPHTRILIDLERAIARAKELKAFPEEVPYQRYLRAKRREDRNRRGSAT
jgi:hypothetical protein